MTAVADGNAVDIIKAEIKALRDELQETVETKAVEASSDLKEQVKALEAKIGALEEKAEEAKSYYTPGVEVSEAGEKGKFSFARMVQGLAHEMKGKRGVWDSKEFGYEGEYFAEMQKKIESGVIKTYTGSTDATGAYLIGTDVQQSGILPFVRSMSTAYSAGVRRMDGLSSNISWVKGEGGTQHYWVDTEAEESITESRSTFSVINARPHPLACLSKITWGMLNQPAESIEAFIREEMGAEMALAEDKAIYLGPGSNSEPLGILNTAGILTQPLTAGSNSADTAFGLSTPSVAGTSEAFSYFRGFLQKLRAANTMTPNVAWVMEDAVAEDIEAVVRPDTGLPAFLGDGDGLLETLFRRRLFVSTNIDGTTTDRTVIAGDFSRCVVPHWGAMGFAVSDSDDDDFKKARVTVRALTALDVAVLEPKAFVEATTYGD